jgi:hypothetical protein
MHKGQEGRDMLDKLYTWWQSSTITNSYHKESISLLKEGSRLEEAEQIAREMEPAAAGQQYTVLQQLKRALTQM